MRAIIATLIYCLLAASPLGGQSDTARTRAVRVQTDSTRKETCRGGTLTASGLSCSGATASPRVTVLRRLANRVDSLMTATLVQPPPVVTPPTLPPVIVLPPTASTVELPRVLLSFPYPTPQRSVAVPAGANLQTALTAALPGDELVLAAGATYTGNFTTGTCGAGWLILRSSGTIPAGRITPTKAAPLAKLVTPNTAPALKAGASSCKLWLSGVEITIDAAVTFPNYGLVVLEGVDQVLDRLYIHGQPTLQLIRAVSLQGRRQQVSSSWLSECHASGSDTQAIWGGLGAGPYKITDNYLECAGENIMFGGADPSTPGLVPSDIEIRGNHLRKPLTWLGAGWTVKNLLEIKNAVRVLVEGNVLDGSWYENGGAIIVKSANQGGACPWCRSTDITIRRNLITNAGSGIAIAAKGDNPNTDTTARRVLILENVIDLSQPGNRRGAIQLAGTQSISWLRNVVSGSTNAAAIVEGGAPCTFDGNVWLQGSYGVFASGAGSGTAALNKGCGLTGWTWTNMTLIGPSGGGYPVGTTWAASESAVPLAATIRGIVSATTAGVVVPP